MTNSFRGERFFLSNFAPVKIVYGGREYPSVEHAYQAAKTEDPVLKTWIAAMDTPAHAKQAAKKMIIRPDWDLMKLMVMKDLLRLKFKHPEMRQLLLDTGTEKLIEENEWGDTFWGTWHGQGKNYLGQLLMAVRREIVEEENNAR